jgi:dTDP-4-amino-4,6-dideoxygalactose transaminase
MTNIAAAIGRVQLQRLPEFVDRRRANAERLTDVLDGSDITPPPERSDVRHSYNQYTVRTTRRDELADRLSEFGIDTAIYYPTPVHEQPAYADVDCSAPASEQAAEEVLSLPVHPRLSPRDVDALVTALSYIKA